MTTKATIHGMTGAAAPSAGPPGAGSSAPPTEERPGVPAGAAGGQAKAPTEPLDAMCARLGAGLARGTASLQDVSDSVRAACAAPPEQRSAYLTIARAAADADRAPIHPGLLPALTLVDAVLAAAPPNPAPAAVMRRHLLRRGASRAARAEAHATLSDGRISAARLAAFDRYLQHAEVADRHERATDTGTVAWGCAALVGAFTGCALAVVPALLAVAIGFGQPLRSALFGIGMVVGPWAACMAVVAVVPVAWQYLYHQYAPNGGTA